MTRSSPPGLDDWLTDPVCWLGIVVPAIILVRKITALPMPRNLTLEPKYFEALNRWQLYISPMLSSTGKPQRLFCRTKRAAETAAEVFEPRQKISGGISPSSLQR